MLQKVFDDSLIFFGCGSDCSLLLLLNNVGKASDTSLFFNDVLNIEFSKCAPHTLILLRFFCPSRRSSRLHNLAHS